MSDFLKTMAARSAERAAAAGRFGAGDFDRPVAPLSFRSFDVIAEIKQRSPAEGELGSGIERKERAKLYASAGACAISVLTEPSRFDGDLSHLDEVAGAVPGTPVMRKDFLVDAVQVLEARKAGASGVLLIATMLKDDTLAAMLDAAFEHRMFVLLECFDAADLERASAFAESAAFRERAEDGSLLVGVNTRNLRTLDIDRRRLEHLAPALPRTARRVAESGLQSADDAANAAAWGYELALVGSALMRSSEPALMLDAMLRAGRGAVER